MPSSLQTLPLVQVFDYLYDPTTGLPVVGANVTVSWQQKLGTVTNPLVEAMQKSFPATTDANGYWTVSVVPTDKLGPANSTYHVSDGYNSYDINPITAGMPVGGWQSVNIRVAPAPAVLAPNPQTIGALTVTGLLTAQAGLTVSAGMSNLQGGLTVTGGATISNGLTVSAGGAAITGNSTVTGTLTVTGAFTVGGGNATNLTGATAVGGLLSANAGLVVTGTEHTTGTSALDGDVTLGARLIYTPAVAKLLAGATSFAVRDSGDANNLLLLTAAGLATLRNALSIPPVAGGVLATTGYGTVPIKSEEQTVVGAVAATITLPAAGVFPTGFRHMKIRIRAKGDAAAVIVNQFIRFNGDNGANYDAQVMTASGVGANPTNTNTAAGTPPICSDAPGNNAPVGDWSDVIIEIRDYNAAIRQAAHVRSIVKDADSNTGLVYRVGMQTWRTTAALTSIVLALSSGNFAIGTEVTTYLEP